MRWRDLPLRRRVATYASNEHARLIAVEKRLDNPMRASGYRGREQVLRALNCEFLPPQADHLNYSLRRLYVDEFYSNHVAKLEQRSHVLDLGGVKHRKRGQFDIGCHGLNVVYANLSTAKQPDVQSDAAWLPFKPGSFDAVICAELLEHVRDPLSVLREVYRVLRSQGVVLISAPFLYQIHGDPSDYGRYTDQYWREHLAEAGFASILIERQGLFWSVVVDMVRSWANESAKSGRPRSPWLRRQVVRMIGRAKRLAVAWDTQPDSVAHPFFTSFTTGFGVVAIKDR